MSLKQLQLCRDALALAGVKYKEVDKGFRWIITGRNNRKFDYWPSSGRFTPHGDGPAGRGIAPLLRACGAKVYGLRRHEQ